MEPIVEWLKQLDWRFISELFFVFLAAYLGSRAARKSESYRYREWLLEKRFNLYNDMNHLFSDLKQLTMNPEAMLYGIHLEGGDARKDLDDRMMRAYNLVHNEWVAMGRDVGRAWFRCLSGFSMARATKAEEISGWATAMQTFMVDCEKEIQEQIKKSLSATDLHLLSYEEREEENREGRQAFKRLLVANQKPKALEK